MPARFSIVALMIALGAAACAPPALDADHASSSQAESGGKKSSTKGKSKSKTPADGDDDEAALDDDDDAAGSGMQQKGSTPAGTQNAPAASSAPASFAAVYDGIKTSCGSCHLSGAGGAPTFFGDTEASTYEEFKNQNFATDPSPLVTKGAHAGPALTAAQESAITAWLADEK